MQSKHDWQEAFNEQIPRLRRYAYALTQDREGADDLVQDCLERAWRYSSQWQAGSNLRAWLFTIMHNIYVNQIRRYKAAPDWVAFDPEKNQASYSDPDPMVLEDLYIALATLSAEHKEVLLLVALEQMSYAEVSQILGIPLGTVMSRLARARERLRKFMSEPPQQPKLRRIK